MKIEKVEMKGIIFKNSKTFASLGSNGGEGLIYCGNRYTNPNGCPCGECDGSCGPTNGCPCPDCEYTLSFLLYSTGKMKCEYCKKTLLRINIFNLLNITESTRFRCGQCDKYYNDKYIPMMRCIKCKFNLCPKCAFTKLIPGIPQIPKLELGYNAGIGMIYCSQNYTHSDCCLCSGCDGNCGPENGCPCPLCEAILGYNIYSKSINMNCPRCKNLFVKTTVGLLKKIEKRANYFECHYCKTKEEKHDFQYVYYCYKCGKSICKICAFKFNIKGLFSLQFPKVPLFLNDYEKEIREKIKNEKKEQIQISHQKHFRITTKKDSGHVISVYLKTLVGRIYTINIDDGHGVANLKEELRNIDKKFRTDKTVLIYKNKMLEDDACINDLGIDNESLINVILK